MEALAALFSAMASRAERDFAGWPTDAVQQALVDVAVRLDRAVKAHEALPDEAYLRAYMLRSIVNHVGRQRQRKEPLDAVVGDDLLDCQKSNLVLHTVSDGRPVKVTGVANISSVGPRIKQRGHVLFRLREREGHVSRMRCERTPRTVAA